MMTAGGPPRCPQCGQRLGFGTDRLGRTTESCLCGYRGYVALREGEVAAALPHGSSKVPPII
jgi:hypothetical protein